MILDHLIQKRDYLLQGLVQFADEPALYKPGSRDNIEMSYHLNVGVRRVEGAYLLADLLGGAIDHCMGIPLEEALEAITPNGVERTEANGAVIVVVVLLLTSQTYGEVPVLLLTFVTAMLLNQGSNFLLGKISFVSNSVTSILQLALSLDYAVILCNHFKEQHETLPIREAAIAALAHSIPEISASSLTTPKLNESQIADNMVADNFAFSNMRALIVPSGDYEKGAQLLEELEIYDEIDYTMGLANVEAMDGYMLADALTPRQFSELSGLDYEVAQLVYAAYAAEDEDYSKLMGNIASYKVPLIDMFLFVCDQVDEGYVTLDAEQTDMLMDAKSEMQSAKAQLSGEDYSRMLLYPTLPESGDETYSFIDTIRSVAQEYYPRRQCLRRGQFHERI